MDFAFDHVHLVCKDCDGMVDFFTKIFGAERASYSADFKGAPSAVIKLGNMHIFVRGVRPGETPDAIAPTRVQGLDHFGVTVDDVEKAVEWLEARGATVSVRPGKGGMGGRLIAFIKGPENIDIEIVGKYVGF